MASVLGYKGAFGLQEELTFKGTITGSVVYEKLSSHNDNASNNFYRPDLIDNDFNRSNGTFGAYSIDGDLGSDCRPTDFLGMVLYGVMGSITSFTATTTGGSGTITALPRHVYSQAQTLPSFRGLYKIGDSGDKLNIRGMKFDSFSLNGADSAVTWTANFMGGYDELRTATMTVVFPSQDPFMFYQMSITVDGATDKSIESFSFSLNNNLEVLRHLEVARKREASAIERTGKTDLSLSLDINYETMATYREFWGNTTATYAAESATRYSITIACNGFRYQTTVPEIRYQLIITLPACEINSAPIPQSTGRVIETLDLTPVAGTGKPYAVAIELHNTRGTTYA